MLNPADALDDYYAAVAADRDKAATDTGSSFADASEIDVVVSEFLGDFPLPDYRFVAPRRDDDCEQNLRRAVENLARAAWARNSVRNTINSRPRRSPYCDPASADGCATEEMRLALAEKRLQMLDLLHQLHYLASR